MNDLLGKDLTGFVVTVEGLTYDGGPEPSGVTRHSWYPAMMAIAVWKDVRRP